MACSREELERKLEKDRVLIKRARRQSAVSRQRALEARAVLDRAKRALRRL